MNLLLISPEDHDERELLALPRLFAAGLAHYHLRKPAWDRARLAAHLYAIPAEFHPRLVLHTHHDLAADFALGGLHFRDSAWHGRPAHDPTWHGHLARDPSHPSPPRPFTSRACHDLPALLQSLGHCSRILLSPIFPSLSKPGHNPPPALSRSTISFALEARSPEQRRTEVAALGGIDAARLPACRSLGFDAAAVLGAVWRQPDPVAAFQHLLSVSDSSVSVLSVSSVVK